MADRMITCHHCCSILTEDECEHYIYECHTCVMTEYDLVLAWHRGDDHPEVGRLFTGPVVIALPPDRRRRECAFAQL